MKFPLLPVSLALLPLLTGLAGAAGPRIVGGTDAPAGAYPFMTALLTKSEPDVYTALGCAGSLIHPRWVLTAGHCVEGVRPGDLQVVVGATDLNAAGLTRLNVLEIIRHPDYSPVSFDNDLALLLLETPAPVTAPVEIIDDPELVQPDVLATVIGWGSESPAVETGTPVLKQVQIPVMDSATANQPDYLDGRVTANMIALGMPEGGVDTCTGDSGGPMLLRGRQNQWVQAGIISWGDGCAQPRKPGVYTRVSKYRQWIQSYVWPEFAAWETAAGIDSDSGPDVDGDGATQWLEYALRRNPVHPDDASGFPVAGQENTAGRLLPTLTLRRPAGGGNLDWALQSSPDLFHWDALAASGQQTGNPVAVPGDSGAEEITWRGLDGTPSSFLRAVAKPGSAYSPASRRLHFPGVAHHALHSLDSLSGGIRVRRYLLTGLPAGESPTLTLRSEAFNPVLRLINAATGAVISAATGNNAGGNDEKISFLPAGGITYAAEVATQSAGEAGDFTLAAFLIPSGTPAFSGSLPQTKNGSIAITDPADPLFPAAVFYKDDFVFSPATSAAVTVTMGSTAFFTSFSIVNAETNELLLTGSGIPASGPALQSFVPKAGVTYFLRASTYDPEATGDYTFKLATTTTLAAGGSKNGQLQSTDGLDPYWAPDFAYYSDDYLLTGAETGVSRTITVSSTAINSTLELLDAATGQSLDYADDPNIPEADSVITFTPAAGRSYLLRVSSYDEEETGNYTIRSN